MGKMKVLTEKSTGLKMYPVGKFLKYQHVFYNASDMASNSYYDALETGSAEEIDRAEEWRTRVDDILDKFNSNPQVNGVVYAYYEDYKTMKDIIGGYAERHNGYV